jgi:hypothetical protein
VARGAVPPDARDIGIAQRREHLVLTRGYWSSAGVRSPWLGGRAASRARCHWIASESIHVEHRLRERLRRLLRQIVPDAALTRRWAYFPENFFA